MTDDEKNEVEKIENEVIDAKKVAQHRSDDYEYSREVLYTASERLQDVLQSAVELAQESEHPRAIEVATGTATALGDVAEKLMKLHIASNKVNEPTQEVNKTTNNLNVKLNTSDLLELLNKE